MVKQKKEVLVESVRTKICKDIFLNLIKCVYVYLENIQPNLNVTWTPS